MRSPPAPRIRRTLALNWPHRFSTFDILLLLLAVCVGLCIILSVFIHGRIERHSAAWEGAKPGVAIDARPGRTGKASGERRGRAPSSAPGNEPESFLSEGRAHAERRSAELGPGLDVGSGNSGKVIDEGRPTVPSGSRRAPKAASLGESVDNAPRSGPRSAGQGASACLLVNDENPRLPEWIAYHYHVLPLRSLTVAVDPAGRYPPHDILKRWEGMIDVRIWAEKDYLPEVDSHGRIGHGPCDRNKGQDCLWRHRKRQRYFVKRCMLDFKRRNATWVLLTDVDEYVAFNNVEDGDPAPPLDHAPEGVPTMSDWKDRKFSLTNLEGKIVTEVHVEGTVTGIPDSYRGKRNGFNKKTGPLKVDILDYFRGPHGIAYGNLIETESNLTYFLRDDFAFRTATEFNEAPPGVPTLLDTRVEDGLLKGRVYNDTFVGRREDGTPVEIPTNWKEAPAEVRTNKKGHLVHGLDGTTYFARRESYLWPPYVSPEQWMEMRERLPGTGGSTTVLDVLDRELDRLGDFGRETLGPCLSMPRILYGANESASDPDWVARAPGGYDDGDFVTLRYRYHAAPEAHANKYQKTIVDVSRVAEHVLIKGEAENIHVPIKYHCRQKPPRYSASLLRVHHYLDSFEAYDYRNDARGARRREAYDEKARGADEAKADGLRGWLGEFVAGVGEQRARVLLDGAGNFFRPG